MKENEFRELVDRELSGLVFDARQGQKVRRAADEEERPMKKRLSTGLIIVISLHFLTMAVGMATVGFGMLDYKDEQAQNEAFVKNILTLGQQYEDDSLSIRVNEAVFNGTVLSLTMDVEPKEGASPLFVLPRITAQAAGKAIDTFIESSNCSFADGFFAPAVEGIEATPTRIGIDVALIRETADGMSSEYAPQTGSVEWTISFDVFKPNWPMTVGEARPSMNAEIDLTFEQMDALDAAYEQKLTEAYAQKQILLSPDFPLSDYALCIPQRDGVSPMMKSMEDLLLNALQSDAFAPEGRALFSFTAQAAAFDTAAGRIVDLGGGWQAELISLNAAVGRVNCAIDVTRATGETAGEAYWNGVFHWDFALLVNGKAPINVTTNGYCDEQGTHHWLGRAEVAETVHSVTIVPCRTAESWAWLNEPVREDTLAADEKAERIYQLGAPCTQAQREHTFTVKVN